MLASINAAIRSLSKFFKQIVLIVKTVANQLIFVNRIRSVNLGRGSIGLFFIETVMIVDGRLGESVLVLH